MSRYKKMLEIIGDLSDFSVYKIRGSDEPVVRRKGGPSSRMVKTHDAFENTRRYNMEFGGRATISSHVMNILRPMKLLGDYNLAGPLNAMFKPIQGLDTVSDLGERNIELTKNPKLLEGINLNRRTSFESIIANPLKYTLSKDALEASVTFPELIPNVNFFLPGNFGWYKFIAVLGMVPDVFFNFRGYCLKSGYHTRPSNSFKMAHSDWFTISQQSKAVTLTCNIMDMRQAIIKEAGENNYSCLLGVGIAFGAMDRGEVEIIKYVGGGKILAMV
ncbi:MULTISPECIES: hypothetical protein [Niastella]|uniref:Uncharacterized protein n=1 Tax=Niastella soli TaxID=2821487 RepID=A0ABS3YUL1_9BACT|nr:hypothetical protein [Niastella soli]MBO9201616.1 hypothetical protein [Niastella soli]